MMPVLTAFQKQLMARRVADPLEDLRLSAPAVGLQFVPALTRAQLQAELRLLLSPQDVAAFNGTDIDLYASYYNDGEVGEMIARVAEHMQSRLAARAAGTPFQDDPNGIAGN